jgi:tetratricopeptide (TPR) repeat protein
MSVALAAGLSACASRQPAVAAAPAPVPTRDIEMLIERGCYGCLEQALALADQRRQPALAFEAAALLALRATELGMPSEDWIARTRTYAAADPERTQYLEMVTAVPPDPLRGLRDDLLVETQIRNRIQAQLASVASWYDVVQTGSHSEAFRRYLELTLICAVDRRPERFERLDGLVPRLPDLPLLKYRVGVCDDKYQAQLRTVQSEIPEFVDADFALGRYALRHSESPDQDEALRRFRSAAAAFPTSTAIPTTIGNLYQSWEDWANALTAFDEALALLPSHPDARLGRVISLSSLDRHDEAIVSATELIDGGRWHLGQAFYWRAWNYFNIGNNEAARADADRTRTLMVNPAVFLLSGMIEWRFLRRVTAETEFQEALTMDFGQCEAAFYLGGVRAELRKLPEATAAMNQARQCYDLALSVRRKMLDDVLAGPGTPESTARDVARHRRSIARVEKRRGEVVEAIDRLQTLQTGAGSAAPTSRPSLQGR